jgi:phage terminase small subunit
MAKKSPFPSPPAHLAAPTKRWWQEIVAAFELESHHLRILQLAAESWDRAQQARRVLAKEGLTYLDRFKAPRNRPEVAIERDSRLAFARLIRELSLDVNPPAEVRKPRLAGTGG